VCVKLYWLMVIDNLTQRVEWHSIYSQFDICYVNQKTPQIYDVLYFENKKVITTTRTLQTYSTYSYTAKRYTYLLAHFFSSEIKYFIIL